MDEVEKLNKELIDLQKQGEELVSSLSDINGDTADQMEKFITQTEMMLSIAKNMLPIKRKLESLCQK